MFLQKNILINASNLHNGGGIQVAASFLDELSKMAVVKNINIHVFASSEVAESLTNSNTDVSMFALYKVINTYGIKTFFSPLNKKIKKYDLVFTVFGPSYLRIKAKKEIVGFAQAWILNFNNPVSKRMNLLKRNTLRLSYHLKWLFFLRADHYIVELEHVKRELISKKKIAHNRVSVAYNTVSSLYIDNSKWKYFPIEKGAEEISLGIVTRDYPHKNINIFPLVAEALKLKHNIKVHFYTTLNDNEWETKDSFFKKYVSTVGSLSPDQCPSFYKQLDGVVFPSLLECFSATPLESMVMKKPLFASDRGFVRDVCGEHVKYFDPLDPDDIALKIATYFKEETDQSLWLKQARVHALNFSSARGRAEKYIEIIRQQLKD